MKVVLILIAMASAISIPTASSLQIIKVLKSYEWQPEYIRYLPRFLKK